MYSLLNEIIYFRSALRTYIFEYGKNGYIFLNYMKWKVSSGFVVTHKNNHSFDKFIASVLVYLYVLKG